MKQSIRACSSLFVYPNMAMDFALVVGVYGISGSGKSHALSVLKDRHKEWRCLDGSEVIAQVMQERDGGTLEDFKRLSTTVQNEIRDAAIRNIRSRSGVTIIAGHFSFLKVSDSGVVSFEDVFTDADRETYDAILYLDVSAEVAYTQRTEDNNAGIRMRESLSIEVLEQWILHEKDLLPRQCKSFVSFPQDSDLGQLVSEFVASHSELLELLSTQSLREAIKVIPAADVYLLIDGDRTITPQDTGRLFFDHAQRKLDASLGFDPLQSVFKRYNGYTFRPFLDVAMLYSNNFNVEDYSVLAKLVGSALVMFHEGWVSFLTSLPPHVHPILVSSSIREVWQAALQRYGLFGTMSVIAGNHLDLHGYLVGPQAKAVVVDELRRLHRGCIILAFGDSALDIPMLQAADRGYISLDPEHHSVSMQRFIDDSVAKGSRCLYQMGLAPGMSCEGYHDGLKVGSLKGLRRELKEWGFNATIHFTSEPYANILATQTRRADLRGPVLQAVHADIGLFLSSKLMEVAPWLTEPQNILHVQQKTVTGLTGLAKNLAIVALMRGGEPMARGVFRCFPDGQFIHYDDERSILKDLTAEHIIVVDSVINRGDTIRHFLAELGQPSSTSPGCQVYVLTGVIQKSAAEDLPRELLVFVLLP